MDVPKDAAARSSFMRDALSGTGISTGLILILGAIASILLFMHLRDDERKHYGEDFRDSSATMLQTLAGRLDASLMNLDAIHRFYNGSEMVERAEFSDFVMPLVKNYPEIDGVAWIPQKVLEDGIIQNGRLHKECYVEPSNSRLQNDLSRNPINKLSERATAAGMAVSSSIDTEHQSFTVCIPVFKKRDLLASRTLQGLIVAGFKLDELLKNLPGNLDSKNFTCSLSDMGECPPSMRVNCVQTSNPDSTFTMSKDIFFAGRRWEASCKASEELSGKTGTIPWVALAACLLATATISALSLRHERRRRTVLDILEGKDAPELREAVSVRWLATISILPALILPIAILTPWIESQYDETGKAAAARLATRAEKALKGISKMRAGTLSCLAKEFELDKDISEAWLNRDIQRLHDMAAPLFGRMNSIGLTSLQFIAPDRKCLLSLTGQNSIAMEIKPGNSLLDDSFRFNSDATGFESSASGMPQLCVAHPLGRDAASNGVLLLSMDSSAMIKETFSMLSADYIAIAFKEGLGRVEEANAAIPKKDFVIINSDLSSDKMPDIDIRNGDKGFRLAEGNSAWLCHLILIKDRDGSLVAGMIAMHDLAQTEAAKRHALFMIISVVGGVSLLLYIVAIAIASRFECRLLSAIAAREREEAAKAEIQERLHATLHSIGDGVISTDVEGLVSDMNSPAEEMTGWTAADAKGRHIRDVFRILNAKTRSELEVPVERVLREGKVVGLANHTSLISKDGSERQIADSAAPIKSKRGSIIGTVLVFSDVTESYRMRESIAQSEARFRSLFDNMVEGVALHKLTRDNSGKASGYMLTGVNPQYERIIGISRDIVIGKPAEDVYGIIPPPLLKEVAEVADTGAAMRIEYMFKPMGRVFDISIAPMDKDSFATIFTDITMRKAVEEELKRSEERYRTLIENIDLAITLVNSDYRIVMANKAAAKLFQRKPEDFIGMKCHDRYEGMNSPCATCPGKETMETGHPSGMETLGVRADGSTFRARIRSFRLKDENGGAAGFIEVAEDISESWKSAERQRQLEQQLSQAQKMESIDRLAGGIAHDFNNMLTPILGYAEMILAASTLDETQESRLEQIVKAAMRARDLTRQLLAFGRKQPLEIKPVSLNLIINSFERMLRRTIRENIAIHTRLAPYLPMIEGDEGQIEQVILNLAINAQDAMPRGGSLTIESSTTTLEKESPQGRSSGMDGECVMLSVSDTGTGMDKTTMERIFEPFFTTKTMGSGTGLGLSSVYGIVKQLKGGIWVSSELGKGSSFNIYFPISEADGDALHAEDSKPPCKQLLKGSGTILVAEDDENVRTLAREILAMNGYSVLEADSGEMALEIAASFKGSIDLLLSDLVMPGINGRELHDRLLQSTPDLKVIFMSGYTNNVFEDGSALEPGETLLQKPFSIETLLARVRKVLP